MGSGMAGGAAVHRSESLRRRVLRHGAEAEHQQGLRRRRRRRRPLRLAPLDSSLSRTAYKRLQNERLTQVRVLHFSSGAVMQGPEFQVAHSSRQRQSGVARSRMQRRTTLALAVRLYMSRTALCVTGSDVTGLYWVGHARRSRASRCRRRRWPRYGDTRALC